MLPFLARLPPCTVVMEACGPAHHRAREIGALGHEVGLIPPAYARPFAKRGKSDAIDAKAVCEAASRPSMRFVPVKSIESQALSTLHRARALPGKQRTMLVNALSCCPIAALFEDGRATLPNLPRCLLDRGRQKPVSVALANKTVLK